MQVKIKHVLFFEGEEIRRKRRDIERIVMGLVSLYLMTFYDFFISLTNV